MVMDQSVKEQTHYHYFLGWLFPISSKWFLYASSHRQDSTYQSLCGALVGLANIAPPWRIVPVSYTIWCSMIELHFAPYQIWYQITSWPFSQKGAINGSLLGFFGCLFFIITIFLMQILSNYGTAMRSIWCVMEQRKTHIDRGRRLRLIFVLCAP